MRIMSINNLLYNEWLHLKEYEETAVMISTTSKHDLEFGVLPRRFINGKAIVNFMINDINLLTKTLSYFDGEVNSFYIDTEKKQKINLLKIAKEVIIKSNIIAIKQNDNTLESCDLLIRYQFNDDLIDKYIFIFGIGNLASNFIIIFL